MANLNDDLNNTIASAVNARVEAQVLEALASDGVMQAAVQAALSREVPSSGYDRKKKTILTHLLHTAIEEHTKAIVAEEIAASASVIRDEVRAALAQSLGVITDSLVDGLVANATGRYPSIRVEFHD